MCLNLRRSFAGSTEALPYFTSLFLAAELTRFRNLPRGEEVDAWHIAGRVVGELGYAALIVASLVEMVFRIVLAAILLIPSGAFILLCGDEDETYDTLVKVFNISGILFGPDTILRCIVALFKNITEERFSYKSLALCRLSPND